MKQGRAVFGMAVCVAGMILAGARQTGAADIRWRGSDYGTGAYYDAFSNDDYWNTVGNPRPGEEDVAYFYAAPGVAQYTIPAHSHLELWLDGDVTHEGLKAMYSSFVVSLDVAGYSYTTTSTDTNSTHITSSDHQDVDITDGITLNLFNSSGTPGSVNFAVQGVGRGGTGFMNVTGPNITARATDGNWNVGVSGTGTLTISAGARFETDWDRVTGLVLGYNNVGDGTFVVTGAGSEAAVNGSMTVGRNGRGVFEVRDEGDLYVRRAMQLGTSTSGTDVRTGIGLITGAGSAASAADVSIGGTSTENRGTGELTVADGGHLLARTAIQVWEGGLLKVDGATVRSQGALDLNDSASVSFVLKEARETPFITVDGDVNFGNDVALLLTMDPEADLDIGQFIPLISYGGLTGGFQGYEEGAFVPVGAYEFLLGYESGGVGDTIGLTVIPEPGTLAMVILGCCALVAGRRRRAR